MKSRTISVWFRLCGVLITLVSCLIFVPSPVHANIPDLEGYVLVAGTNAPVVGVWVKLTNSASQDSNCVNGTIDQSRYAKTDANGKYTFVSWTTDSSAVGEGKQIDTNLDRRNDAVQYPTFDSCDPSDPTPGSVFSCGRDPFKLEVIRPYNWSGYFDTYGTSIKDPCVFCINNGEFTYKIPTVYYHRSNLSNTPTATGRPTASVSPRPSASVTPPSTAACSFSGIPATKSVVVGTPDYLTVGVNESGGTVDEVTFTSSNGNVVSVCKTPLCAAGSNSYTASRSSTFRTGLTGFVSGSTATIHVTGRMITEGVTCTPADVQIQVRDVTAWCQFKETDIITRGGISCSIPTTCTSGAGCNNALITHSTYSSPGVPVSVNGTNTGPGGVISKNPYGWQAKTSYKGISYNYSYFDKKVSGIVVTPVTYPVVDSPDDLRGGTPADGYYWNKYVGGSPLEISKDINIGNNKIVLFVDNADVHIKGKIQVNDGRGFFMIITTGDIIVDPSVGDMSTGAPTPDIEGIYFTDRQFLTGSTHTNSDKQLAVRGIVVAFDKIVLERVLPDNTKYPGELFEYGADQLMMFPSLLGDRTMSWKEVAP